MITKSLEGILEAVEELAHRKQNQITLNDFPFVKQKNEVAEMKMSLQAKPISYNTNFLENILLGAIADYHITQKDPTHVTSLLKNTQFEKTMLLDRLKRRLPQYTLFRGMNITPKEIVISTKSPLDLDEIQKVVEKEHEGIKRLTEKQKDTLVLMNNNEPALKIQHYAIKMPYSINTDTLDFYLKLTTGLCTRIHQDNFQKSNQVIQLAEYQPFFELFQPELFIDQMSQPLLTISERINDNAIESLDVFHETNESIHQGTEHKVYMLDKNCLHPHINYVLAIPQDQEIKIKLGSNFNFEKIEEYLQTQNLFLQEGERKKISKKWYIKKGAGGRFKHNTYTVKPKHIVTKNNEVLFTLESKNILSLQTNNPLIEQTAQVISDIYYKRLFYTGILRTAELDTNLTHEERKIITGVNALTRFYTLFVEIEEDQTRLKEKREPISSTQWIYQKMNETQDTRTSSRILQVLNAINDRVDIRQFHKYGREEETQERLQLAYDRLQRLRKEYARDLQEN